MSEIASENKLVEKTQSEKAISKKNEVDDEPEKRIIYLASELPGVPEVIDLINYDTSPPYISIFEDKEGFLEADASLIYQDERKTQRLRPLSGSSLDSKIPKEKDKTTFRERLLHKKSSFLSRAIFLINLFFLKEKYSNFFTNFNWGIAPQLMPEDVFQAKVLNLTKFNRNKLMKKHGISEAELNFIAFARFRYPFITRGEEEWTEIEKNALAFIKRGWISEDIRGNFKINVGNVYEFRDSIIFSEQFKDIIFKKVFKSKTLHKILRKIERSAKTQVHIYNISQISKLPFTQFGNSNSSTHSIVGKNDLEVSNSIKKEPICFTKDRILKVKKTETF